MCFAIKAASYKRYSPSSLLSLSVNTCSCSNCASSAGILPASRGQASQIRLSEVYPQSKRRAISHPLGRQLEVAGRRLLMRAQVLFACCVCHECSCVCYVCASISPPTAYVPTFWGESIPSYYLWPFSGNVVSFANFLSFAHEGNGKLLITLI